VSKANGADECRGDEKLVEQLKLTKDD